MNPNLQASLKTAGWRSGVRRGSLATNRAGIDFEIVEQRGGEGRLELRYRYQGTGTLAEGDVVLPADVDRAAIEDTMTGIYLRVHERPDPTRVFGGGRPSSGGKNVARPAAPAPTAPPPADPTQGTLDF